MKWHPLNVPFESFRSVKFETSLDTLPEKTVEGFFIAGIIPNQCVRPLRHVRRIRRLEDCWIVNFLIEYKPVKLAEVKTGPVEAARIADMFFSLLKHHSYFNRHVHGKYNFSAERAMKDLKDEIHISGLCNTVFKQCEAELAPYKPFHLLPELYKK